MFSCMFFYIYKQIQMPVCLLYTGTDHYGIITRAAFFAA